MNLQIGQTIKAKLLNSLDYGRVIDAVVEDIDETNPKPTFINGRRIGTPIHPKGKLFYLKEIKPDGSFAPTACYHQRHLRVADEQGEWCGVG